jgi:Arc/MetJ family transcription regulator
MLRSMATQKISVTLDASAIARARDLVGPRGLSAYVDAALRDKLERDRGRLALLAYLDELEGVDPTPEPVRRRARQRADALSNAIGR